MARSSQIIKTVVVVVVALICLRTSLLLMPWAELNFGHQFPEWIKWLVDPLGVPEMLKRLQPLGQSITHSLENAGVKTNPGDYMYIGYLAFVLFLSSISFILIGREEAEEKTVLPLKK